MGKWIGVVIAGMVVMVVSSSMAAPVNSATAVITTPTYTAGAVGMYGLYTLFMGLLGLLVVVKILDTVM